MVNTIRESIACLAKGGYPTISIGAIISSNITPIIINLARVKGIFILLAKPAVVFENVNKNDAVYLRAADGQAGKAIASGVSFDAACVIGFAEEAVLSGGTARIIVAGFQNFTATLDPGDLYFLSAATAGQIATTPPSTAGQYVTRVGEASTTSEFVIQIEPPIRLR